MSSLPVAGRLTVVEEAASDRLCAFAKTGGFPAGRWAHDMAHTYNARLELSGGSRPARRSSSG